MSVGVSKETRQIKEAFIDGFLSAGDRMSSLNSEELLTLAHTAWLKENRTDQLEIGDPPPRRFRRIGDSPPRRFRRIGDSPRYR